jgi:hypothetical protein
MDERAAIKARCPSAAGFALDTLKAAPPTITTGERVVLFYA